MIGISNNLQWRDSLYDDSVHFAPYDAIQLESILERRAENAFLEDVLAEEVISLAAAFAAQDKGSARQAIQYLYKAGQLASTHNDDRIIEQHLRDAVEVVERKRVIEGMEGLTTQGQFTLAAVTVLELAGDTPARTKTIYETYRQLAHQHETQTLVIRRVRDHLLDLDMQGILTANERGAGSVGGRYYTFELQVEPTSAVDVLESTTQLAASDLQTGGTL